MYQVPEEDMKRVRNYEKKWRKLLLTALQIVDDNDSIETDKS